MDGFYGNIGILAVTLAIIYGCKKILEYYDYKYSGYYENTKVYKAADKFVHGAASDDVKSLLTSCFDFDREDADEILRRSLPHRTDKDGGYRRFIKSVNRVLGARVYHYDTVHVKY
ncbi:hypothetical protein SAMN02745136_05600 [Anaerocolumna jejuensis DSM 15929]|uniref:Uncharacterized protein n=1 Tax=Anaerocolumna jejuensis DSM 15929 TaxID=1121322 RepID=A0A1M7D4M9_9FIRM|nr:hypothetical protein [Anaerocolumna jejuensis]SHL74353.1 hypothetical protein SAMN02745136_05600 [Anaerocolumna jejuensis DSM 15929]